MRKVVHKSGFLQYLEKFSLLTLFLSVLILPLVFDVRTFRNFIYPKDLALYFLMGICGAANLFLVDWKRFLKKWWPAIGFFLFVLISSFSALNRHQAFFGVMHWSLLLIVPVFVLPANKNLYVWLKVQLLLITAVLIVCGYGLLQVLGYDFFLFSQGRTLISTLGNPNYVGQYLDFAFGFFLVLSLFYPKKWGYLLLSVFLYITVILTSCKGSMLACSALLAACFFYFKFYEKMNLKMTGIAVILILSAAFFARDHLQLQFNELLYMGSGSNTFRTESYAKSVRIIADHPIKGIGPLNYIEVSPLYFSDEYWQTNNNFRTRRPLYVHNDYLQIAAESGLFALVFFMLIIYRLFQASRHSSSPWKKALFAGIVCMLLHSFVSFPIYNYASYHIFLIASAFLI